MSGNEAHRERGHVTLVEILWSWETQVLMAAATYYHYYHYLPLENDALKECACAEQVRSAGTLEIMISVWYAFQVGVSLAVGVGYLCKGAAPESHHIAFGHLSDMKNMRKYGIDHQQWY